MCWSARHPPAFPVPAAQSSPSPSGLPGWRPLPSPAPHWQRHRSPPAHQATRQRKHSRSQVPSPWVAHRWGAGLAHKQLPSGFPRLPKTGAWASPKAGSGMYTAGGIQGGEAPGRPQTTHGAEHKWNLNKSCTDKTVWALANRRSSAGLWGQETKRPLWGPLCRTDLSLPPIIAPQLEQASLSPTGPGVFRPTGKREACGP